VSTTPGITLLGMHILCGSDFQFMWLNEKCTLNKRNAINGNCYKKWGQNITGI
jgi:hypothetical protein